MGALRESLPAKDKNKLIPFLKQLKKQTQLGLRAKQRAQELPCRIHSLILTSSRTLDLKEGNKVDSELNSV